MGPVKIIHQPDSLFVHLVVRAEGNRDLILDIEGIDQESEKSR